MVTGKKQTALERVACDVCLKEVPKSEAMSPEGTEYVVHFCGLDCYEKWKNAKEAPRAQ